MTLAETSDGGTMKESKKKISGAVVFKYLICFLVPMTLALFAYTQLDNDSWFVLAEGRHIVQSGVYKTDVLSMHEGLNITVQNYGFAAMFYLIFSWFGPAGLYFGMIVLNFLVCFLLYKIYLLVSKKNINLSLLSMILTDGMLILMAFVTTRAQMVSYVFFLILIYILERYIREKKTKGLLFIPLISVLQINLHASLWPMLFLVMGVYVIDGIVSDYKVKPIIIAGIGAGIVGFLNPYGLKMMTITVTSYVGGSLSFINEMKPFDLVEGTRKILYMVIVAVLVLCFYGDKKEIKVRYVLMFFGFLALGLNTIKGLSQFILVMLLPVIPAYKEFEFKSIWKPRVRKRLRIGAVAFLVPLFSVRLFEVLKKIDDYPDEPMKLAVDVLDEKIREDDRTNVRVYSGFDDGGYLEFRGYRPYLDPRAEVFLKINNGKEDIIDEWLELRNGDLKKQEFLGKYDFDYLVVRGEEKLMEPESEKYEMVFEDGEGGIKTRVYEKTKT